MKTRGGRRTNLSEGEEEGGGGGTIAREDEDNGLACPALLRDRGDLLPAAARTARAGQAHGSTPGQRWFGFRTGPYCPPPGGWEPREAPPPKEVTGLVGLPEERGLPPPSPRPI